jgi:SAM-dependent methyltransferase
MDWEAIDWASLERLRRAFLSGTAGRRDYWQRPSDLAGYDATFARRIGWKWDFVLAQLRRLGWTPPPGEVLDWGCGTGIAARVFLESFPASGVVLWDRSELAMRFAARRLAERFAGVAIRQGQRAPTVLISHVITELDGWEEVLAAARQATAVLWVEPGTQDASRRLAAVRQRLDHPIVAPCPHRGPCGMLRPENAAHWCHFFAPVPADVFHDAGWARFARLLGVDLRSLPVSYVVWDRRGTLTTPTARVLGRPRLSKALARVLECRPDGAVAERVVGQREAPEEFRQWRKKKNP